MKYNKLKSAQPAKKACLRTKSQAAMEFMLTYSWAIIVVIIVICTLAYFGILDTTKLAPKKCTFPQGLSCLDFEVDETNDKVELYIKNNLGGPIMDVIVSIPGCTSWTSPLEFQNGESFTAEISCDISGGKLSLQPIIKYTKKVSGLTFEESGKISGKIGSDSGNAQITATTCADAIDCESFPCKTNSCINELCTYAFVSYYEPLETTCNDGIDNDCDGDSDCVDSDCEGIACSTDGTCQAGVCAFSMQEIVSSREIYNTWAMSGSLIDSGTWTIGSGSIGIFGRNGDIVENIREMGTNPYGESDILWVAIPDAVSNADGGWNTAYFNIDNTKTYKFTVWIKKTGSNDGSTYFGTRGSPSYVTFLSGTVNSNPYFWSGDLPLLDKWYLLIGYVHPSNYVGSSWGGIYDGETGAKIYSATDFKFQPTTTSTVHRAYLYYDIAITDRQYFWGPTVRQVIGERY